MKWQWNLRKSVYLVASGIKLKQCFVFFQKNNIIPRARFTRMWALGPKTVLVSGPKRSTKKKFTLLMQITVYK